jgi:UDP-4-amino-4,6-dideoxy-N-acetyl-beta-L-altrosamine transaminase
MIPYGRQKINFFDVISVVKQISFNSLTQGSKIAEFEEQVANYVGAKFAVAVSSATAGLHLAVLALELPKRSDVITSPISFVASSNAVLYSDHNPIFIDIERDTVNMDIGKVEQELESNGNVRAVIPVHFAGLPCDMTRLKKACETRGIGIIEDAAHALGAAYADGKKVGSCENSDMTVFSFHPVKSITTGEGGMITTNSEFLYKKLLRLRSHGINKLNDAFESNIQSMTDGVTNPWYYEMQELGFNYRLTEIQAALGISQMKRLDNFIKRRSSRVSWYRMALSNLPYVKPAQNYTSVCSAHHIFPIRVDFSKLEISKAKLMLLLKEKGIGSQVHYMPIPMHPFYQRLGFGIEKIPESMSYYQEALTIPLYPHLKRFEQRKVIGTLQSIINSSLL